LAFAAARDGSDQVKIFGVTLVGVSTTTGVKLAFTVVPVLLVMALRGLALRLTRRVLGGELADPRRFWARQGVQLLAAIVLVVGVVSILVTPGADITTGVGLVSAGLAFALQQVILSLAAYFVILRGDTFGVGDRITLGGVRGDVVKLGLPTDHDHGDGSAAIGQGGRSGDPGEFSPVHRAARHRDQRGDLPGTGLQPHPRLPLHLGRVCPAAHLHLRPEASRRDSLRAARATRGGRRRRGIPSPDRNAREIRHV